jgi:hypothetical protein
VAWAIRFSGGNMAKHTKIVGGKKGRKRGGKKSSGKSRGKK